MMQWGDVWGVGREGWHEGWSLCPGRGWEGGSRGTGTEFELPQTLIKISSNPRIMNTKK